MTVIIAIMVLSNYQVTSASKKQLSQRELQAKQKTSKISKNVRKQSNIKWPDYRKLKLVNFAKSTN